MAHMLTQSYCLDFCIKTATITVLVVHVVIYKLSVRSYSLRGVDRLIPGV